MIRRLFARRPRRALVIVAAISVVGAATAVVTSAIATTPPHTAYGSFDPLAQTTDGFQLRGWGFDPDSTKPVSVDVTIDGHVTRRLTADLYRPDVHRARPEVGTNHGFARDYAMAAGTYKVCVHLMNLGAGSTNPSLGCRSITVNHDPHGAIVTMKQFPGGFTATGWAYDPNQPSKAIQVAIAVDSARTTLVTASQVRTDIPALHPKPGTAHGFTIKALATEGTHRVCIYAKNLGLGADATVGCKNLTVNFSPIGSITSLRQVPGGFRIGGWSTDPDTSTGVITVKVSADDTELGSTVANRTSTDHDGHTFAATFMLPGTSLPPGTRKVCVTGGNLGTYGHNTTFACKSIGLDYNPSAALLTLVQSSPGIRVTGWATDPDTSDPISVAIKADGNTVSTVTANHSGTSHDGHVFIARASLPNGKHTICAIAINTKYGSGNSKAACKDITLNFNPVGKFESVTRTPGNTSVVVKGWAFDPDTKNPIPIRVRIDGTLQTLSQTGLSRPDVADKYPGTGSTQGFSATYKATQGEHEVCVSAANVLGGTGNTALGCRIIIAVHPKPPSAPQTVTAVAGYGGATVSWTKPASDGGAPWTKYVVTASPGGASISVGAKTTSGTITGLGSKTTYTFSVVAVNVAGSSPAAKSPAVTTQASPPPQTTPAPISTSRYIRNVSSSASSTDLSTMRAEGAADAKANPSGHGYLVLLDIGGQDEVDGGVLLSATTKFVSYGNLVKDINAYVDGYHSAQKASAPVIIALGTNNDVDVSTTAGANWANKVVDPVRTYASKYTGVTISGANDIEPGFRGTYAQTKAWLSGYLANTKAPFVNNGSADGCAWTRTNYGCNNGWSMAGLYYLSAGAAPVRIINLPQIYNNTMAAQWKYISLTGVEQSNPRINFGGALTEWTACQQSGSCGSLTGNSAWTQLWNQLQSHSALRVKSLPYSTDLRIDR